MTELKSLLDPEPDRFNLTDWGGRLAGHSYSLWSGNTGILSVMPCLRHLLKWSIILPGDQYMRFNLTPLVAVFLLAAGLPKVSAQTKTDGLKSVEYKTGQVWTTNQNITVTILAVEDVRRVGRVIHVRVDKIPWQSCGDIHLTRAIEHLAVTEKMMLKSALVLTNDNADLPVSSVEAYRKWKTQKKHEIAKVPLQRAILDAGTIPPMICNFVPSQT